jgi:hypothetical protein
MIILSLLTDGGKIPTPEFGVKKDHGITVVEPKNEKVSFHLRTIVQGNNKRNLLTVF